MGLLGSIRATNWTVYKAQKCCRKHILFPPAEPQGALNQTAACSRQHRGSAAEGGIRRTCAHSQVLGLLFELLRGFSAPAVIIGDQQNINKTLQKKRKTKAKKHGNVHWSGFNLSWLFFLFLMAQKWLHVKQFKASNGRFVKPPQNLIISSLLRWDAAGVQSEGAGGENAVSALQTAAARHVMRISVTLLH